MSRVTGPSGASAIQAGGFWMNSTKAMTPSKDSVWICEHHDRMVAFLLLMHRENNAAQLGYFLIEPRYRGIGLGKKLMQLYMEFLRACRYQSPYLWTTHELEAAASLYKRFGFKLTEEKESTAFGKRLREQRYGFAQKLEFLRSYGTK